MLFSHQRGPLNFVFISDICHLIVANAKTVNCNSYSMTNPNRNVRMVDWIRGRHPLPWDNPKGIVFVDVFDFKDIHTGFWGQSLGKTR